MLRTRLTTLAIAVLMTVAQAGAGPLQDTTGEVLTNETVVTMTKAGIGAPVVVAKIRASKTDFDVSVDAMVRLKQEGVDDEVLAAMIEADGARGTPLTPPKTPPESGIYYAQSLGPEEELVLLEPNVYTQSKETGVWKQAVTYGIAKVRYKAVLPDAHAKLRIETRRPTFYFFFDVPNAGLSSSGTAWGPATSANEFILARMDVKKSTRELEVGEDGQYTGRKYGVAEKAVRAFDYERLAPGLYRVTPKEDLADGEYCFLYAGAVAASGAGGGPKLFDFGVKVPSGAERRRKVS
jgi:hypothetical protein